VQVTKAAAVGYSDASTYTLRAGLLNTATTGVGANYSESSYEPVNGSGAAVFTQEGGVHTTRRLAVGPNARYELKGGSLDAAEDMMLWGHVHESAGTCTVIGRMDLRGNGALYELTDGTLEAGRSIWHHGALRPAPTRSFARAAE